MATFLDKVKSGWDANGIPVEQEERQRNSQEAVTPKVESAPKTFLDTVSSSAKPSTAPASSSDRGYAQNLGLKYATDIKTGDQTPTTAANTIITQFQYNPNANELIELAAQIAGISDEMARHKVNGSYSASVQATAPASVSVTPSATPIAEPTAQSTNESDYTWVRGVEGDTAGIVRRAYIEQNKDKTNQSSYATDSISDVAETDFAVAAQNLLQDVGDAASLTEEIYSGTSSYTEAYNKYLRLKRDYQNSLTRLKSANGGVVPDRYKEIAQYAGNAISSMENAESGYWNVLREQGLSNDRVSKELGDDYYRYTAVASDRNPEWDERKWLNSVDETVRRTMEATPGLYSVNGDESRARYAYIFNLIPDTAKPQYQTGVYHLYDYMTDKEKALYNYIWNNADGTYSAPIDEANRYLSTLEPVLMSRMIRTIPEGSGETYADLVQNFKGNNGRGVYSGAEDFLYSAEGTAKSLIAGAGQIPAMLASTVKFVVGDILASGIIGNENFVTRFMDDFEEGNREAANTLKEWANGSWNYLNERTLDENLVKLRSAANELLQVAGNAIGNAALMYLTGGSVGIQTGMNANSLASVGQRFVENAIKSPAFWTSAALVLGNSYEQAQQDGNDTLTSALYAVTNALLSAAVEVSGGFASVNGTSFPSAQTGFSVFRAAGDVLEEGLEEVAQQFIEDELAKILYDPNRQVVDYGKWAEAFIGGVFGALVIQGSTQIVTNVANKAQRGQPISLSESEQFGSAVRNAIVQQMTNMGVDASVATDFVLDAFTDDILVEAFTEEGGLSDLTREAVSVAEQTEANQTISESQPSDFVMTADEMVETASPQYQISEPEVADVETETEPDAATETAIETDVPVIPQDEKPRVGTVKKSTFLKYQTGNGQKFVEQANGYTVDFSHPETGEVITLCFDKRGTEWFVTEQSTGLSIGKTYPTRKAAIEDIDTTTLNRIIGALRSPLAQEAANAVRSFDADASITDTVAEDAVERKIGTNQRPINEWQVEAVNDDADAEPISKIIAQIRHDFGIVINENAIRSNKTLGLFDRSSGAINTNGANDIPTVAHELGHALDLRNSLRNNLPSKVRKELVDNLSAGMKASYPKRLHASEGFAEFVREYLSNYVEAVKKYPAATEWLFKTISQKDGVMLRGFAEQINAALSDTSTAQNFIRHRSDNYDMRTVREKVSDAGSKAYQDWVDRFRSIRRYDQKHGTNAYQYARTSVYADAKAANIVTGRAALTDIENNFVSESLKTTLYGLDFSDTQTMTDFDEYLIARHAPERIAEGMDVFGNPVQNTVEWCRNRQAELEAQHPEFPEIANKLYEFERALLKAYLVDTGLVSQAAYDSWGKRWNYYVPFNRFLNDVQTSALTGRQSSVANQRSPVKRAKGSQYDIVSPLESIIDNVFTFINVGSQNNVFRHMLTANMDALFMERIADPISAVRGVSSVKQDLIDMIENSDLDSAATNKAVDIVKNLSDAITVFTTGQATGNVVTVMVGGKPQFYRVHDPLLLESMTSMNPSRYSSLANAFQSVNRFIKQNITGDNIIWSFMRNLPMDLQTAEQYADDKNVAKLLLDVARAYKAGISPKFADEYAQEYMAMGGMNMSELSQGRNLYRDAVKSFSGHHINPMYYVEWISDIIESGPRYAAFREARIDGFSAQEAFVKSLDATVDFGRMGNKGRAVNNYVLFFNAGVQSVDRFARWIKGEDVSAAQMKKTIIARIAQYVTTAAIVSVVVHAANHRDKESEEAYERLSNYTKYNYYCIHIGGGKFITIPKPREIASLESFFEAVLSRTAGGDDYAFDGFSEYLTTNWLPNGVDDVVQAPIDLALGKNAEDVFNQAAHGLIGSIGLLGTAHDLTANMDFRGNPIVPQSMENLSNSEQYYETTSQIAKWIGDALNISPIRVDYAGSNILGGFWKAQKALFPVDGKNRDWSLGYGSTWEKDSLFSQDTTNWIYDHASETNTAEMEDPANSQKQFDNKVAGLYTTFYSRYNSLAKGAEDTDDEAYREARRTVFSALEEYRLAVDTKSFTEQEQMLIDLCESITPEILAEVFGSNQSDAASAICPSVMNVYVTDEDRVIHQLTDTQYVQYQMLYNALYWEKIERGMKTAKTVKEKAEVAKLAKASARHDATNAMLTEILGKQVEGHSGFLYPWEIADDSNNRGYTMSDDQANTLYWLSSYTKPNDDAPEKKDAIADAIVQIVAESGLPKGTNERDRSEGALTQYGMAKYLYMEIFGYSERAFKSQRFARQIDTANK